MAKAKLTIEPGHLERLTQAAELSDVKIGKSKTFLNEMIVEVLFKNPAQLYKLGIYFGKVADEVIPVKNPRPKK